MSQTLSINKDKIFLHYDINRDNEKDMEYYRKNIQRFKDWRYDLYKKQYWSYSYYIDEENHRKEVFKKTDIKFKKPITELAVVNNDDVLREIKSLPKTLKVLWFQGFRFGWKLPVKVIPKSIMSITFKWSWNPLQGKDLSGLKNLKIFHADDTSSSIIPIFPKNIVTITMKGNPTLFYLGVNFKLSDYPKLKYVNFKGSIDPKRVPKEWKDAKKDGKIEIIW